MKRFIIGLACVAAAGAFFFGQKTPEKASDLTLENIEVVGLSAVETSCEGTNDVECFLYDKNGVLSGKSKGPLRQWN
jgi:hypothetical protein